MLNIYQFYEKFLTLFKKKEIKTKEENSEYAASLFFGLLEKDTDTVDIKCLLPNVDNKTVDEIASLAEKYAQLLVLLHSEAFDKNIFNVLDNRKATCNENYKTIMLIDNIVAFWKILYQAESKKYYQKFKSNQPLIKPSEAFKLK